MNCDFYTQQNKILSWNKASVEDLVGSMTIDELVEMAELNSECSFPMMVFFDGGCSLYHQAARIVYQYVWNWLKELGDDQVLHEDTELTRQLFAVATAISQSVS